MSKYSDDEFVEFIPASDIIPDNNHAQQATNKIDDITIKIDMTLQNQQPTDLSEEETNSYTLDMLPDDDGTRFQIRYAIVRDQLPAIIVFHCSGKLVESNCLVLHNTFKMCSVKNLPFIIFDMTEVSAVEKEVWVYFSSKVSKLQKLNGILLFAGIRSEVLSETTDFNKLNICHCDTVATCCLAIRNLTHAHEKTDSCMIFNENDSSIETQSNIHDFLFNEKPKSEKSEMKLVDSLLSRKKNEVNKVGSEKLEVESKETVNSPTQPQSQPKPDFSPFEQTILINDDGSNPIADAKRKVLAELKGDLGREKEVGSGKVEVESKETVHSPTQPQSQPKPDFSPFEQTILINDDGSNPIADAKRKVLAELRGDEEVGSGKWKVESKEAVHSPAQSQSQSQSQPKPDFSPFEQTILINDDGSNPIVEAKRKVMAELRDDLGREKKVGSGKVEVESKETVHTPAQSQSDLSPIEKVNLNSPGLFEKTILLDDENGSSILDAKKKILEELGKSHKEEVVSEKREVRSRKSSLVSSQPQSLEKTVLINEIGVNPIAETNDSSQKNEVRSGKWEVGGKEDVDSSAQVQSQSLSQPKPKSKPVVSDKSQTLSLKDLYIDDSMSTDYSIVDNSREIPPEDTDDVLPLVDESQGMDYSLNDKKVMSQSATVDISRSSLGLTKTNVHASLKNISPSDPYSVHYGVYEKNAEEKNQTLPAGKTENEKLTAQELVFKVIADYGPVNILQLKNHINEKLDKKDRINTLKLFALLRQVDLDTHEKRVRYYRSC
jgi:Fe-S cluster biosynthesis and repair protein YggX